MRIFWHVGDRAKWLAHVEPIGATRNPPAPRYAQSDFSRYLHKPKLVTVTVVDKDGHAQGVKDDDGVAFDPSIDPDNLVPLYYGGWERE